jgi:hypothetical protein
MRNYFFLVKIIYLIYIINKNIYIIYININININFRNLFIYIYIILNIYIFDYHLYMSNLDRTRTTDLFILFISCALFNQRLILNF